MDINTLSLEMFIYYILPIFFKKKKKKKKAYFPLSEVSESEPRMFKEKKKWDNTDINLNAPWEYREQQSGLRNHVNEIRNVYKHFHTKLSDRYCVTHIIHKTSLQYK